MAKSAFIKVTDHATPHLAALKLNVIPALEIAVFDTLNLANNQITRRVLNAHTRTGEMRVAGINPPWKVRPAWWLGNGPGRVESGKMIGSVQSSVRRAQRKVVGQGGFVNPPRYTALQEEGNGVIEAMGAFAVGKATFTAQISPQVQTAIQKAIAAANSGRTL